jgi:NAD(P)H dehydrogenase (quinone)
MTYVGVVYDSGFGHTAALARAAGEGALEVPGVRARMFFAPEVALDLEALESCDALIFGTPTYMGSGSADFKHFMESTAQIWARQSWRDRLAAGFTSSGGHSGDKLATLMQLTLFAMQHGMVWVGLGLLDGNNRSSGSMANTNRLGSYLGAMSQANTDQGLDGIPASDLDTARHLGRRVATLAANRTAEAQVVPA